MHYDCKTVKGLDIGRSVGDLLTQIVRTHNYYTPVISKKHYETGTNADHLVPYNTSRVQASIAVDLLFVMRDTDSILLQEVLD